MFATQLAYGKAGESVIAAWLRTACRYHVLPVYEKQIVEGKGPVLFSSAGRCLIAPDLLAVRRDQVKWIEAKTKNAFTWHRTSGQWVTGIDLRHYRDYLELARLSPWPIWLLFLHLGGTAKDSPDGSPTGLFGGELLALALHEHHRSERWGTSGMVYWAQKSLQQLATVDDVTSAYHHLGGT
jgi:hypothetical protein